MMLVRKLRVISGTHFNICKLSRCQLQACRSRVLASQLIASSLNSFELRYGFTHPSQSFSTAGGTILVQARDAGKLSEGLLNAINEHRFDDAWSLHQQHMQMEGFPRKSIVNMLLESFAESLDPHWLEKAFG